MASWEKIFYIFIYIKTGKKREGLKYKVFLKIRGETKISTEKWEMTLRKLQKSYTASP